LSPLDAQSSESLAGVQWGGPPVIDPSTTQLRKLTKSQQDRHGGLPVHGRYLLQQDQSQPEEVLLLVGVPLPAPSMVPSSSWEPPEAGVAARGHLSGRLIPLPTKGRSVWNTQLGSSEECSEMADTNLR
jgi:hypothetical protein